MNKTVEKNINVQVQNQTATITYQIGLKQNDKESIKIKQALMKIKANNTSASKSGHKVYLVKPNKTEIIDYFQEINNLGYICIDITDELIDAIKSNENSLNFQITNITEEITFVEDNQVIILHENSRKVIENNAFQEINVKNAGFGKVNLATGNLAFSHVDTNSKGIMPINIFHAFSSEMANKYGDDLSQKDYTNFLNSYNCGKGWKLNFEQYLIKNKPIDSLLEDGETSGVFRYIMADGKIEEFKEKFYYEDNNGEKHYLYPKQILLSQNGNLTYSDENGVVYEVKSKIENDSGLMLQTEIEGFCGLSLLQTEIDEIANLKAEIKTLKNNISDIDKNLTHLNNSKEQLADSKTLTDLNNQIQQLTFDYQSTQVQNELDLNSLSNSAIKNEYDYNIYILAHDMKNDESEKVSRYNAMITSNYNLQNRNCSYKKSGRASLNVQRDIINKNIEYFNSSKNYTSNELKYQKDKNEDEEGILKRNKTYYEELKQKKEYELEKLQSKVPSCIIVDNNRAILGFSKTPDENIYRLSLVADAYENSIQINYDEKGKITSIVSSEEKTVALNYNDDGLLSEIIDTKNRKTKYEYDENDYLVKITYPNNQSSTYAYNVNGLLTVMVDSSGYGVKLDYTNKQLTKITEMTSTALFNKKNKIDFNEMQDFVFGNKNFKLNGGVEIVYYDYKSTTLTNSKTGKRLTYIFDTDGQPVTIYENKFENGTDIGNVMVRSFERDGNKRSFEVQPLLGAENLINGARVSDKSANLISEFYLGSGSICGTEIYSTSIAMETAIDEIQNTTKELCNDNLIEIILSDEALKTINSSSATDYVLSGWAKADSAWVKRRLTDYCVEGNCGHIANESELDAMIRENADESKLNRRFELRAEITLIDTENGSFSKEIKQFCSFDWMQTDWQYVAFPVTIEKSETQKVSEVKIYFDYSFNTGTALFYGARLQEGKWEYKEFNADKLLSYSENSESKAHSEYVYDENKRLEKVVTTLNERQEETLYFYNANGSLVRTISANGMVSENFYDSKGQVIKSYTYHKDEPASKIYSKESALSEKGQEINLLNELGEAVSDINYTDDLVTSTTANDGTITAYGYDAYDDTLLQTATTIDSETNTNVYGYTYDLLTSLSHNDFEINYEFDGFGRQSKVSIAGTDYVSTEHEEIIEEQLQEDGTSKSVVAGEKITNSYASGEVVETKTNNDGNVTEIKYSDGLSTSVVQNLYDRYGRLIRVVDGSNETPIEYDTEYDKFGNKTKFSYVQYGKNVEISSEVDDNNVILAQTFKLGDAQNTTKYKYSDEINRRLIGMNVNGIDVSVDYDKLGRVKQTSVNGNTKIYSYLQKADHATEKVSAEWFNASGNCDCLKYSYDSKGNITKIMENGKEIQSFEYDGLSRLTRENNKKLGKTLTFEYDAGGNIIRRTEYNYSIKPTELLDNGKEFGYNYAITGWKDQLKSYNGENFEYDALGNPTTYRNKALEWNRIRCLESYNDIATFKYNANGIRISKSVGDKTTHYYLDGTKILAQYDGNLMVFNYGADGLLGFIYNDEKYYYKKNMLGDILAISDETGTEIVRYEYDAWGNHKVKILSNNGEYVAINSEKAYSVEEANNITIAKINPFRYRSYYFDSETGLYYLNSRYYDPEIGRFINADDLSYIEPNTLNGINLYEYCLSNPINLIDTLGCYPNSISQKIDYISFLSEFKIGSILAILGLSIKTISLLKNTDSEFYNLLSNIQLNELTKASNTLSRVSYALAIISICASVVEGIQTDINRNYSADRIISNVLTNTLIYGFTTLGIGIIGSKVGALFGSVVPGIGNVVGAALGFVLGIGVGMLLDLKIDGTSIIDHFRNSIYHFWHRLFG